MYKEPVGLYILRFIFMFGMFAFMGMLYWSSLVLEENLAGIRSELSEVKNELASFSSEIETLKGIRHQGAPGKSGGLFNQKNDGKPAPSPEFEKKKAFEDQTENKPESIGAGYSNLLHKDPFYAVTLPKLLGSNFKPHGVFHDASLGHPKNLHPFSNWSQVSGWVDMCIPSLSKLQFGKYETFAPDLAVQIEERRVEGKGYSEFWVRLRDQVYWEPLRPDLFSEDLHLAPQFLHKHQVTAHDFKFYFDAMMNPFVGEAGAVALRNYYDDVKEIEIIDDLTFIVRWKTHEVKQADGKVVPKIKYQAKFLTGGLRPLASFVYQYFPDGTKIIENDKDPNTYRTNSVWAQNFSNHWASNIIPSCGAWTFDGMTERSINFKRNPNYYFPLAVLVERDHVEFKEAASAIWQDFQANKLDSYSLQPEQLIDYNAFMKSSLYKAQEKQGLGIKRLDYLARTYSYIGWNEAKPFFFSKKVRQALTMAINRQRIIEENLNGMGLEITGPFYRYSPSYDKALAPWPYDPDTAKRLLEEEGWYDRRGTGIIENIVDGKPTPFQFTLIYYVKNSLSKSICDYIATALREVGILCSLNGVDIDDLSAAFDDKSFDAIALGWSLGNPPEDPKQLWSSTGAKQKGSSNAIGFANAEVDRIISQLEYEEDEKTRLALYHRFDQIIYDECPYTFLYSPMTAFLYRSYLQNVFIPKDRQDLVPGADMAQPDSSIFWIKE